MEQSQEGQLPRPDWRGLCEELVEAAEHHVSPYAGHHSAWEAAVDRARAALAQPEPEVVGPSDDSGEEWQWYTYCPEEGIELYPNRQQAQSAAQSIMGSYEVAAHSDGWHEDMELVSWGMLVPVEQAQVVARGPADPDGEFDEWVRYELKAVARYGRPAPAPAGERQAAPVPVAVSERPWEREGWCDDEGRCWFCNAYSMGKWSYETPPDPDQDWGRLGTLTHSLPHGAIPRPLPLPTTEPQP